MNNQRNSIIKAFNTLFEEFLNGLVETFPEETKIPVFLNYFKIARKANKKYCLEWFYFYTTDYEEQILNKDEAFLLQDRKAIDSMMEHQTTFKDLVGFRNWWDDGGISDETKSNIWNYIQSLYQLSKAASNSKIENEKKHTEPLSDSEFQELPSFT